VAKLGLKVSAVTNDGPIVEVALGSPFQTAGVQDGDLILSVDGMGLLDRLRAGPLRAGRMIPIVYRREGNELRGAIWLEPDGSAGNAAVGAANAATDRPGAYRDVSPVELMHGPVLEVIREILDTCLTTVKQLESQGMIVEGLAPHITALVSAIHNRDCDPEHLDREVLLGAVHGLKRSTEDFAGAVTYNETDGADSRSLEHLADHLVGYLLAVTRVFETARPRPDRLTELVSIRQPDPSIPLTGGIRLHSTSAEPLRGALTAQVGTAQLRQVKPYGGDGLQWSMTDGSPVPWNDPPATPDFLEDVPADPAQIEEEIALCERLLAKTTQYPHHQEQYGRRLAVLRSAALGLGPPARPVRKPDGDPFQPMDDNQKKSLYWSIVNSYPDSVTYINTPIAFDELTGAPIEYRTDPKVDPAIHKIAISGFRKRWNPVMAG
jgi:hypothetical protein